MKAKLLTMALVMLIACSTAEAKKEGEDGGNLAGRDGNTGMV